MTFILASKSPRRRELLAKIIEDFEIIVSQADESLDDGIDPCCGVGILAVKKGDAVYSELQKSGRITDENKDDFIIISSDTLVAYDKIPLGKPCDEKDAERMLSMLSGKTHSVHTGVAVRRGDKVYSGVDTTFVTFKKLTSDEISEYVKSGEPMDKAGAYGIQGNGGKFVLSYQGEYDTVVGLGLKLTEQLLREACEK